MSQYIQFDQLFTDGMVLKVSGDNARILVVGGCCKGVNSSIWRSLGTTINPRMLPGGSPYPVIP